MRNSAIKASTGDAPSSRGPQVAASSLNCPSACAERAAALDIQRERLSKVQAEYIQNPSMDNTPDTGAEVRRLETLLDAARLLNSTLELKELTQIILDVVRAEVPVDRISVFVVDRGRNTLHSLVAQEVEDFEITLPMGAGTAGTVAATGEILDIADAYADPRFESRFDQILQYRTRDLFALPVNNRQGVIVGVLELINRQRPIIAADREFLLGISVFIGLALQNAWAHRQVRAEGQFEQELVALRDNLAEAEQISLTSELLSLVLQEISNPLARRCHCSGCSGAHGQRDFKIFDFLSDQRVQGISSTIDYEHRYPVDRDFGTNNIQYNLCEFLQFERRVQQPRRIQQRFQPADLGTRIRRILHRRVLYILRLNFRQELTLVFLL